MRYLFTIPMILWLLSCASVQVPNFQAADEVEYHRVGMDYTLTVKGKVMFQEPNIVSLPGITP